MKKTQVLLRIAHLERLLNRERPDEDSDEENGRSRSRKQSSGGDLEESERNFKADYGGNERECVASKFLAVALTVLLSGFIYFYLVQEYLLRASRR